MTIRNFMIATLLLTLAGCGCNDDSSPPRGTNPLAIPAVLGIKTVLPPIPVMPPRDNTEPFRIDVAFIMDDGNQMVEKALGIVPSNPADGRTRSQAAQAIFRNVEANVQARFAAEWTQQNPGIAVPPIDLAFAVARYEDFGGDFTAARRQNGDVDDVNNDDNDRDARPWILNMALLRQAHPQFAPLFANALTREAPGDGHPYVFLPGIGDVKIIDPQSGIEALYQAAAPTAANGDIGGLDGLDVPPNGTTGSGAPTSQDPARNPQTRPGGSGDVPAVRYLANGVDGDGRPLFTVADSNGAPVMIPDPLGGGVAVPSPASGNLGQVGWREDAARFILLASSIATVAPTENALTGTPEVPGALPPPVVAGPNPDEVMSTAGAPDAPREARTVLLGAFDGGPALLGGQLLVSNRRTGPRDGTIVAPTNAHTVNEAIARLNALGIEVLLIGNPAQGGLDTKPGVTGVNGDIDSHIESDDFDPTNPLTVQPDFAPWTWFNAVNTLTTPPITSIASPGRVTPELFWTGATEQPGDINRFWGVYNAATVWPYNGADQNNEGNIRPVVTDDLAERIVDWVAGKYIPGGTSPAVRPELPTVEVEVTLELIQDQGTEEEPGSFDPDVVQVAPLDGGSPKIFFTQTVQVPTYYSDTAAPANVTVSFPLPADGPFQYATKDDTIPLPASRTQEFILTSRVLALGNTTVVPANTEQQAQIMTFIVTRGDGVHVDSGGTMVPLGAFTDQIVQGKGAFTVTMRDASFPGPGAQLSTLEFGCAILNDLTANQDSSDQGGGVCPFPINPPIAVP